MEHLNIFLKDKRRVGILCIINRSLVRMIIKQNIEIPMGMNCAPLFADLKKNFVWCEICHGDMERHEKYLALIFDLSLYIY